MFSLTDEETESYNNRKFFHICKKKIHDVDDSNDGDDRNSDDNDEESNARKFHVNASGHDEYDGHYDHDDDNDDDEFDARKCYGDGATLDDIDDYYYDHHDDGNIEKLISEGLIVMLRDLIILMMGMVTLIVTIMNLTTDDFMVMLIMLMFMTMGNSMVWDFLVSVNFMKECAIIVIIKENTEGS